MGKFTIEVDVRDAREANAALKDVGARFKNDGSDNFVFTKERDAEDAMADLEEAGIKARALWADDQDESLANRLIATCNSMSESGPDLYVAVLAKLPDGHPKKVISDKPSSLKDAHKLRDTYPPKKRRFIEIKKIEVNEEFKIAKQVDKGLR